MQVIGNQEFLVGFEILKYFLSSLMENHKHVRVTGHRCTGDCLLNQVQYIPYKKTLHLTAACVFIFVVNE